MSKSKITLIISAVLIVIGGGLVATSISKAPELECAKDGAASTGYSILNDDSTTNCMASQESLDAYDAYRDRPRWPRATGVIMIIAAVLAGGSVGVATLAHRKKK